jgi:hypothetical protein
MTPEKREAVPEPRIVSTFFERSLTEIGGPFVGYEKRKVEGSLA